MGPVNACKAAALAALFGRLSAQRESKGFTLVEMLVVLLVIGLAAGLAYARLEADPRQTLEHESRQLAAALEHAALLAQWRSEPLGISASGNSYRFWRRGSDANSDLWVALSDDDVLAAHILPAPLYAAAREYAGRPVAADAILPLRPSGRNEPYAIEIASDQWRVLVLADPLNRVAISDPALR
jgi:general secretion pathway protein H